MDFVANATPQWQKMLRVIGVEKIEDLLTAIPSELRCPPPADDDGLSEQEVLQHMEALGKENNLCDSYLGAGAYEHHVPAFIAPLCGRGEFLTAYTPYQPEGSQGMLQAIYEYQSAVCALTGLDAANASVYDAASACAEAVLMALRHRKKERKVYIASSLHPHYRAVIEQYLSAQNVELVFLPCTAKGTLEPTAYDLSFDDACAILVQYPNFFGVIDAIEPLFARAKQAHVVTILCANPMVYGLYASAKELRADIAVGDMQPFGIPLQFGGPYAGYMACTQALTRQLPGRIIGKTTDSEGKEGFVITLQAREQHIRREKATSNICTNQSLAALASLMGLLWYGKQGLQDVARTNFQRASYLRAQLAHIPGFQVDEDVPLFNEFVVRCRKPVEEVLDAFRCEGIAAGLPLVSWSSLHEDAFLVAVTEMKSKKQLDRYVHVAKEILQ